MWGQAKARAGIAAPEIEGSRYFSFFFNLGGVLGISGVNVKEKRELRLI